VSSFSRRDLLKALAADSLLSSVRAAAGEPPLFREMAVEAGLNFHHLNGATGQHYMPEIMGPGVALFDYDNDGDLDIYLVQGNRLDPSTKLLNTPPAGWKPGNRLFKNLLAETGELRFVDVTEKAGVGHIGYGMGVAAGDYDNDGFVDLYVTNFGHNVLYHNNEYFCSGPCATPVRRDTEGDQTRRNTHTAPCCPRLSDRAGRPSMLPRLLANPSYPKAEQQDGHGQSFAQLAPPVGLEASTSA
jgi:hypothetical protein